MSLGRLVFLMAGAFASAHLPAQEKSSARSMYFAGLEGAAAPAKKSPAVAPDKKAAAPVSRPSQAKSAPYPRAGIVPAANVSRSFLGLRYSILKVTGLNSEEVPVDTRFRSGDTVRLKVQSNSGGYLYIVHRGTSGSWSVLFPRAKDPGPPRIEAGKEYTIPENSTFRFRGDPGIEKLFVVLSREPEHSLDDVIFSVRERPGTAQPKPEGGPILLAQNRVVADPLISSLRQYSRDLVIEDVRDDTSGRGEQAVYIVNTSGSSDSRVIADIQLVHQ